jgi:glycosyltransferase involved in cell wall biosynthesis
MISVLILTFDEEVNIANCILSIPWRDDIVVLDSGSRDGTVAIAHSMGATIVSRGFTNYADQRNYGLAQPGRHEWIVMLDADERMTPELAVEIERCVREAEDDTAMFVVRRRDMFMRRWLRRSSGYPTWFPRVIRRGRVRVEREINEVYIAEGATSALRGHLEHYPFNKGMEWWFARHNHYSTAEARLLTNGNALDSAPFAQIFSSFPGERRAALKRVAYLLPGRPFVTFFYLYVIRFGFLDGWPGYQFALMRMAYEIMIDAKVATSKATPANARRPGHSKCLGK